MSETKRCQSSSRPSIVVSIATTWSQSEKVCDQKPVHHAWFIASSVLYFAFSQSRKACMQSGHWQEPLNSFEMCQRASAGCLP